MKQIINATITQTPLPQFTTVQAGRGVAAIAVLLFHTLAIMSVSKYGKQTPFGGWTKSGDLGVDFFFVLSSTLANFEPVTGFSGCGRLDRSRRSHECS